MEPAAPFPPGRVLAHNLLLRSELERVDRVFRRDGVEWLVLKGLPLAERVYGSLAERFCVDNDVLVRARDVARAAAALGEIGYEGAPGRTLSGDRASTFQHPMRRIAESGLTVRLELHWNAFPPHLFAVPEALLWEHVEECPLDTLRVRAFAPELCLVHLASHLVQHRCAEPRILRDFGLALSRWRERVDAARFEALAMETGTRSAVAFAMLAAFELELTRVPPLFRDPRARALFGLLGAERLSETGEPGYARMALSILLSPPGRWLGAFGHELFPPLAILSRITERPASPLLYASYLPRIARAFARGARRR